MGRSAGRIIARREVQAEVSPGFGCLGASSEADHKTGREADGKTFWGLKAARIVPPIILPKKVLVHLTPILAKNGRDDRAEPPLCKGWRGACCKKRAWKPSN